MQYVFSFQMSNLFYFQQDFAVHCTWASISVNIQHAVGCVCVYVCAKHVSWSWNSVVNCLTITKCTRTEVQCFKLGKPTMIKNAHNTHKHTHRWRHKLLTDNLLLSETTHRNSPHHHSIDTQQTLTSHVHINLHSNFKHYSSMHTQLL